ncbi:hypothetical protein BKA69DRAFT_1123097 [Paraphysoderma sedebokerense]|nr:hypothetical protein BKA69DRAFT_1123097 [Paraphysoderma sedebokerense]
MLTIPKSFYFTPSTKAICVVLMSSLNDWTVGTQMFDEYEDGVFQGTLNIPTDKDVEYKFIVDGVWMHDANKPSTTDPNGQINNILHAVRGPNARRKEYIFADSVFVSDFELRELPMPTTSTPVNSVDQDTNDSEVQHAEETKDSEINGATPEETAETRLHSVNSQETVLSEPLDDDQHAAIRSTSSTTLATEKLTLTKKLLKYFTRYPTDSKTTTDPQKSVNTVFPKARSFAKKLAKKFKRSKKVRPDNKN